MVLERDTDIVFPHFMVLRASAGSGKTHALTRRFVQFLLSKRIPHNDLRNIIAITFSNNAAREMKVRILGVLKEIALGDPVRLEEMGRLIELDPAELSIRATACIELVLDRYADFQVRTIDSFMTAVFKASALDFGYNPEFDILMDNRATMAQAFERLLRRVRTGSSEALLLECITDMLTGNRQGGAAFIWNPSRTILDEVTTLARKLAGVGVPLSASRVAGSEMMKQGISDLVRQLDESIDRSGLLLNSNSRFPSIARNTRSARFADVRGGWGTTPPVKKPTKGTAGVDAYDEILSLWHSLGEAINAYTALAVREACEPAGTMYREFSHLLEAVKRREGTIFIEDVNRYLAEYLDRAIVPDIYYRLGDTISHFLIDEFQDTSPIQWRNLFPLIENALAGGGTLFVVGDTKQAIYGFREADYTIMKEAAVASPFPAAQHQVRDLPVNYRSTGHIVGFIEGLFRQVSQDDAELGAAARASGLSDFSQQVREGREDAGYVTVSIHARDDDAPPERDRLYAVLADLMSRGYRAGDIAVLSQRNDDIVGITGWLSDRGINAISYSSLDIRRRTITGELMALISFLDSPLDNLSFSSFALGGLFKRLLATDGVGLDDTGLRGLFFDARDGRPWYKAFQRSRPDLWDRYFADLFRLSGYLPLYDLVAEIYGRMRVFDVMPGEEATLVRFLEAVKACEGGGGTSLHDFIELASGDEADTLWKMDIPQNIDAVKVMTIHKAKGLGFPAVVVILYEEWRKPFDYLIEHADDGVRLIRLTKDTARCSEGLQELYQTASLKEMVNRLNSLYVGLTRAETELHIIGLQGASAKTRFPVSLLPREPFAAGAGKLADAKLPAGTAEAARLLHSVGVSDYPVSGRTLLSLAERRRGEFIHALLASVSSADDPEYLQTALRSAARIVPAPEEHDEILETLRKLFANEDVRSWFIRPAGRVVWVEKELADHSGRLFRIDRVLIDTDTVTILEFKTGARQPDLNNHLRQLGAYMRLVGELLPSSAVRGFLVYIDTAEIVAYQEGA